MEMNAGQFSIVTSLLYLSIGAKSTSPESLVRPAFARTPRWERACGSPDWRVALVLASPFVLICFTTIHPQGTFAPIWASSRIRR